MDKGFISIVAFLDLKKAFDTIDHKILVKKLQMYGVEQRSLKLLESYLSNRSQTCFINRSFSKCKSVRCGIPQRSILGPLLFSRVHKRFTKLSKLLYAKNVCR